MNLDIYKSCFRELQKEAGLGTQVLEHAGGAARAVGRFGRDVGEAAVGAFRPSAIREGAHEALNEAGKGKMHALGVGITAPLMAHDTMHTLKTDTDPMTGRHIGVAERGAVAAGRLGAGISGFRYMNSTQGIVRGMGVQVLGGMGTDAVTSRVGRAVDNLASRRPAASGMGASNNIGHNVGGGYAEYHPAAAAGGAPVARGA